MKLVASAIIRNEADRYLEPWANHLLEFCDQLVVIDDASDDSRPLIGSVSRRFVTIRNAEPMFFQHEGRARQHLLDVTLAVAPTHVLAIDADEFIDDGPALRRTLEKWDGQVVVPKAYGLVMEEVWEAETDGLCIREDGGWRSHGIPAIWHVPEHLDASYRIADRALACGRVPVAIDRLGTQPIGNLLHFGWANETERQTRYDRYAEHDRGRFHASAHLQSILAPCEQITLRARDWPAELAAYKDELLERANGVRT